MMARPFLIDDNLREKMQALKENAEANIFSMDDLLDIENDCAEPPGNRPGFAVLVPIGYCVCFSIEDQPAGYVRHLSVSVDAAGKLPSPFLVEKVMKLLGFTGDGFIDCEFNIEDIGSGREAISVLQVIE